MNLACRASGVSFFWAGFDCQSGVVSVFCDPNPALVKGFQGENSRADNDLLVTEEISSIKSGSFKVICAKKHHLEAHSKVVLINDGSRIEGSDIQVTSDKEFIANIHQEIDCDKSYIVKLLLRPNDSSKYVCLIYSKMQK